MKCAPVTRDVLFDSAVHVLWLDAPPGNVVDAGTCDALRRELEAVRAERHAKLVALRGRGEHFSWGASVPDHVRERAPAMLSGLHAAVKDLVSLPVMTAALVSGKCLGGGFELALACGLMLVEDGSVLGSPEIKLGVFAPAATALLEGRVPQALAEEILLTGRNVTAEEAVRWGLANARVASGELDVALRAFHESSLAARSAASLRVATAAARAARARMLRDRLDAMERVYLEELLPLHDGTEGIHAFMEKRPPRWEDR
jgi:cyclohexa-1,5-dienecarbonyl-CoA hydratase